jgi:vancomycin resistance protein YoaR
MSTVASAEPSIAARRAPSLRGVAVGFLATLVAAVVLAALAAVAIGWVSQGRVLPGVHVGGISLAGTDASQASARLSGELPSLAHGSATLVVAGDGTRVPYSELGRAYDLDAMRDAALAVGRRGEPVADALDRLRALLVGVQQPIRLQVDQERVLEVASSLSARFTRFAVDATVTRQRTTFTVSPSTGGEELSAITVRDRLISALLAPDPGDVTIELTLSPAAPAVSTETANQAAGLASQMAATPLTATNGTDRFTIAPEQIAGLLTFGVFSDRLLPQVDATAAQAEAAALAKLVDRAPRDATYRFGATISVVPAVAGRQLDQATTANAISQAINLRASGGTPTLEIPLSATVTQPSLSTEMATAAVSKIRRISTWTTYYVPGISNGFGVNISIPAQAINGKVIAPGALFDFWKEIGPVTTARGYRSGGAIINGKSEPTGALAGGICSTSTTLFNTALRAGLEMHDRLNHYYYISRYPVGLDATVYQDTGWTQTMSFRNDTPYPLIIRAYTGTGFVRFDLYGVPTGRTVTFTKPVIRNWVYGHDTIQYTTSLAPGVTLRIGDRHDGFDATVIRYVRDANGTLIHTDTYFSHYHPVTGVLLVGKAASTSTTS